MSQYPIPQFIEAEGKIVSFLTFRQFFILVGGGIICIAFYYTLPLFIFVILSILVAILAGIIAFLKIDDASVIKILFTFLKFTNESKNYIWKKKSSLYPFKVKKHYEIKNVQEFNDFKSRVNRLKDVKKIVELRKK